MYKRQGLNSVIHPGTLIYTILDVMSQTGSAVFNNLALLFAMGVAIGMARKEKEVAALSGAVAYIIMNTAIQAMINAAGGVDAMPANSTTTMPVSYTHLDVYKRQHRTRPASMFCRIIS